MISQREDFVKEVLDHADLVEIVHQVFDCIDPKDNKFLEVPSTAKQT